MTRALLHLASTDDGEMPLKRRWTGAEVVYDLSTPLGVLTLTSAQVRALRTGLQQAQDSERGFVADRQREQTNPEALGLVNRDPAQAHAGDRVYAYVRPDADPSDPYLIWKPATPGASRLVGRWEARLPLRAKKKDAHLPPVKAADWNDAPAIADLAGLVLRPAATWALYALAHPEVVAEHRQQTEEAAEKTRQLVAARDNARRNEAAMLNLLTLAQVEAKTVYTMLRARHIGDGTDRPDAAIRFESLPMDPRVLLADPATVERVEFTGTSIDLRATIGDRTPDQAGYPVAGWRMMLYRPDPSSPFPDDAMINYLPPTEQHWLGRGFADRLRAALEPKGLKVVEREDGYWIIRDEAIFDLLHAAWITRNNTNPFGSTYYTHHHGTRRIDIPKRSR